MKEVEQLDLGCELTALSACDTGSGKYYTGEGVMGLFDGAADGSASTAELSERTGWPVVLVVDAHGMAASAAALVHGYASYRPETKLAGIIFNRVGGRGHGALLAEACAPLGIPVLGALPRNDETLIALAISSATDPMAKTALKNLKELESCEMHITHLPKQGDEAGLIRLKMNVTTDAKLSLLPYFQE